MNYKIFNIGVAFFLLSAMVSCESKKKEIVVEQSEWRMQFDDYDYLLEYLYVDKNGCIHATRECDILDSIYRVEVVDTSDIKREHFNWYCSECINIPRYKHIESIVVNNELKQGFSLKPPSSHDDVIEWVPGLK